jgi:hypothetical protein
MQNASSQTTARYQAPVDEDEKRRRVENAARLKYGKSLSELSKEERMELFRSFKGERAVNAQIGEASDRLLTGKQVGNVYAAPNVWGALAGGVGKGVEMYRNVKLNQAEAAGRETAAGVAARNEVDERTRREDRADLEEERWLQLMRGMSGQGWGK